MFDLDSETERDTAVTLRGLKMENSILVNIIDKAEPSDNMTTVRLKTLEQHLWKDSVVGLLISACTCYWLPLYLIYLAGQHQ